MKNDKYTIIAAIVLLAAIIIYGFTVDRWKPEPRHDDVYFYGY